MDPKAVFRSGPTGARTGGASAGALPAARGGVLQVVQVRKVGGSGGGQTTTPSWTYNFWLLSQDPAVDAALNSQPLQPAYGHLEPGLFVQAADDTLGLAFRDPRENYQWKLLWVFDERRDPGPCSGG